jgi:lipoprotein NlpI
MQQRISVLALFLLGLISVADEADLVREAQKALKMGESKVAKEIADKILKDNPKNEQALFIRGEAYAMERQSDKAIADFNKVLELNPNFLLAVDRRGGEYFKQGKITESIQDFDTYIKAYPKSEESHWRRGISYYYAEKYKEGAKQFELGKKVYGDDVENAFWHYLCLARIEGVEKARQQLLKIGNDRRPGFMTILKMIQGQAKPEDVFADIEKQKLDKEDLNEALFYAHLYIGLNYEAQGNAAKSLEHITQAVDKHPIGHYMWDVAAVHKKFRSKK